MFRAAFSLLMILVLTACQPAPVAVPAIQATATMPQSEIPHPTPTVTQPSIPTVIPSPTVSPAALTRRAGPICENAFSALVESGPLTPPFAVLKETAYADSPSWQLAHQLPHLGTLADDEVRTLFCISETRFAAGTYADGAPAFRLFWDVRVVSWPDGRVIGRNSFTGSLPPETNASALGAVEGSHPDSEFAGWVFNEVDHPDFIHFKDAVTRIAISPNGRLAAFGTSIANQIVDTDYPAQIFLFRPSDMQIVSAVNGHQGTVTSLAFSPDGRILASSGYDLFVKFWDVGSSRLLGQVHIADTPNSLVFSPDGAKLAVASNLDVAFVDVRAMRIEQSLQEASGRDLAYSPDGALVYVNSLGSIKMIDPQANIVMLTFPDRFALVPTMSVSGDGTIVSVSYEYPETVDGFALSPNGERIVSYTVNRSLDGATGAENVRLAAWNAKTGKYMSETTFSGDQIRSTEFAPDGERLAMGNGSEIWLWDTASWQVEHRLTGHTGTIVDLAFHPEGTTLFSAGSDGTIRAWSIEK